LQFTVVDKFGNTVNATDQCWNGHVLPQRPHLRGEEQRVKDAISDPEKVLEGNTPDAKEFWGKLDPGKGFRWGGVRVVALVNILPTEVGSYSLRIQLPAVSLEDGSYGPRKAL
jgi:hypothetical protein